MDKVKFWNRQAGQTDWLIVWFLIIMILAALLWLSRRELADTRDRLNGEHQELLSVASLLAVSQTNEFRLMMELEDCKKRDTVMSYFQSEIPDSVSAWENANDIH